MGARDALRKFKQVRCGACGAVSAGRNLRWDSYVCLPCDAWCEEVCCRDDPDCWFCYGRPENPSQVISNDDRVKAKAEDVLDELQALDNMIMDSISVESRTDKLSRRQLLGCNFCPPNKGENANRKPRHGAKKKRKHARI